MPPPDRAEAFALAGRKEGESMTQRERQEFLIRRLLDEQPRYRGTAIPADGEDRRALLRGLMNLRPPGEIGGDFLAVQDEYLRAETAAKGITDLADLEPAEPGLYLWRGDITALRVDAIVNAANSGMTGCYVPGHNCIDNCIHTFAGVQLRLDCARLMEAQGHPEPTGRARITSAYNLPCRYVLHTVGPIVEGAVTAEDERLLASCYRSCMELAAEKGVESLAFCCISTGVFHYPRQAAAQVAVRTVRACRESFARDMRVVFNVHSRENFDIYRKLLG